jgi:hypothetical protein
MVSLKTTNEKQLKDLQPGDIFYLGKSGRVNIFLVESFKQKGADSKNVVCRCIQFGKVSPRYFSLQKTVIHLNKKSL